MKHTEGQAFWLDKPVGEIINPLEDNKIDQSPIIGRSVTPPQESFLKKKLVRIGVGRYGQE